MDTNRIVTEVATNVALGLIAMIGAYVVAYIHKHLSARQIGVGVQIARVVVSAAEQIGKNAQLSGPLKFDVALSRARDLAGKAGVHFSDDQWRSFIEQAVHEIGGVFASLEVAPDAPVDAPPVLLPAQSPPSLVLTTKPPGTPITDLAPVAAPPLRAGSIPQ